MASTAISAQGLGKRYMIAAARAQSTTLRDALSTSVASAVQRTSNALRGRASSSPQPIEIWALKDVSFTIEAGEAIGIIGRNGAGKSTLLKILSRITTPTTGHATVHGRAASLLEVGTGFHPELTGRENVFLNGAILGMSRSQIRRRFDEIVAFAEVETFLDTPIKRYSSGMSMRLAFAVAAHLDPEILIVDEVLAVGDAAFQKKCLSRLDEVSKSKRTVLFVSHNMGTITRLCSRAIWVDNGRIVADGPASHIVARYLAGSDGESGRVEFDRDPLKPAQLLQIAIVNHLGVESDSVLATEPISIRIRYCMTAATQGYRVAFVLNTPDGSDVLGSSSMDTHNTSWNDAAGVYETVTTLPANLLNVGTYVVSGFIGQPGIASHDRREYALLFQVEARATVMNERWPGPISIPLDWQAPRRLGDA